MGIKLPGFLGKALSTATSLLPGPLGGLAKQLLGGIEGLPPEERARLDAELKRLEHEEFKLALQDSADLRQLAMAELKIDDKFVRRTRPGILVGIFGVIGFWIVLVPLLNAIPGVDIQALDMSSIPEQLWWLAGSSYLGYGAYRTFDKRTKTKNGGV